MNRESLPKPSPLAKGTLAHQRIPVDNRAKRDAKRFAVHAVLVRDRGVRIDRSRGLVAAVRTLMCWLTNDTRYTRVRLESIAVPLPSQLQPPPTACSNRSPRKLEGIETGSTKWFGFRAVLVGCLLEQGNGRRGT